MHGIAHDAQMDEHPEVEVIDKFTCYTMSLALGAVDTIRLVLMMSFYAFLLS